MLSKRVLQELIAATKKYPTGLIVLEENEPKFVVVSYDHYQRTVQARKKSQLAAPKKVLVTGGAGYIGSHAARQLLESGYQVVSLDNLSTGHREFAQGEFVEGDLSDLVLLEELFSRHKFDAVMHFAAFIEVEESMKNPLLYFRNNVLNGIHLLEMCRAHNVKHFIFSSSCTVYGEEATVPISEEAPLVPVSAYGETKLIFEKMLRWHAAAHGLQAVSLRYFNAAGASLDSSLGLANEHSTLLLPNALHVAQGSRDVLTINGNDYPTQDGTAIRDYIHVLDLALAHQFALDYLVENDNGRNGKFEVFNVGTGKGYSVLEIINAVCEYTGHMVKFEYGPRRPGDRPVVIANPGKIQRVLGWQPQYSDLKTIITTAWAWHKKRFGNF